VRPLLLAVALVVAACGGAAAPTTTAVEAAPSAAERPEGRRAPDFELQLGQGGVFALSDEQNPVYMVFWAEW